jgi:hypothetical protein
MNDRAFVDTNILVEDNYRLSFWDSLMKSFFVGSKLGGRFPAQRYIFHSAGSGTFPHSFFSDPVSPVD